MKRIEFLVSIFLCVIINQFLICTCHPIFSFDFFGSSQSTTPESVISDYRHQKKTDSSFDHINLLKNVTEEEPAYTESNADFYAEVFGRLIGNVRNSFADLIGDIKKRNQYFRERNTAKDRTEKPPEKSIDEVSLEAIMKHLEARLQINETSTNSDNNESEQMSRKLNKRNPLTDIGDAHKVGQLTIPINLSLDYDLISDEAYPALSSESDMNNSHWLRKYFEFFEQLKENHHNKKERKIMNLLKLILTPVLKLNMTQSDEENFDNEIMFNIIQGNRTIGQLTPFQIIRILHKESNDRIQLRMKLILKRIVYKYARLYYIARKNYKNSHGHYQDLQSEESDNFRLLDESIPENELVESDFDFPTTNDGRHSFNSLEGLAIVFLEIFGALFALTIGFWAQVEGGFFYDLLE